MLSYGAATTGSMLLPNDTPTRTLYASSFTSLAMWGLLIPFYFK